MLFCMEQEQLLLQLPHVLDWLLKTTCHTFNITAEDIHMPQLKVSLQVGISFSCLWPGHSSCASCEVVHCLPLLSCAVNSKWSPWRVWHVASMVIKTGENH